ncbi:MAG: fibronectin/fibrinogen-binding protein [Firmicutes bacterium]|nr:fibronectin/fibrinogen-binding protein [Bacillota bacterium]
MAMDGLILAAVREEMQELIGCRITKIYQPGKREIVIHCRRPGTTLAVILSADPQYPRVYLTEDVPENPLNPPSFCMLLRKYLEGGKITAVEQPDLDRILQITVENIAEHGGPTHYRLIAEIMGRHSNIILLDAAGQVLDAVTRVDSRVNRYREIVPGAIYIPPPDQGKLSLLALDWQAFLTRMAPASPEASVARLIQDNFTGISPQVAVELVSQIGLDRGTLRKEINQGQLEDLYRVLLQLGEKIKEGHFAPQIVLSADGEPRRISAIPLTSQFEEAWEFFSMSRALETYYAHKLANEEMEHLRRNLIQVVEGHQDRLVRKIKAQERELSAAEDAETYRTYGELLTANIHRLQKGLESVTLENFYNDLEPVTIPLDPRLTPAENAQDYFRRYSKAKKTKVEGMYHYQQSLEEQVYLEQVRTSLDLAVELSDLLDIQRELMEEGYIRPAKGQKSKELRQDRPQPLRFWSSDGLEILVGRNNRQNDYLTFRIANPDDMWLHVKDIPGSHVVIRSRGTEPPAATLKEAALLAAHYSKSRAGHNVAVDYTARKHVRKPRGAKPGMVIYDHYRTIFVSPLPEIIQPLLARQISAGPPDKT